LLKRITNVNQKVGVLLDHGVSLCFISSYTLNKSSNIPHKNSVRSTPVLAPLYLQPCTCTKAIAQSSFTWWWKKEWSTKENIKAKHWQNHDASIGAAVVGEKVRLEAKRH